MSKDDVKAKYEASKAALDTAAKTCRELAKDYFKSESVELFKRHPEMKSFGWHQYTPYFNDGDPCVFRCCRDYVEINKGHDGEIEETDGMKWDDKKKKSVAGPDPLDAAARDAIAFLKNFTEDDLQEMFGDHVEITVTAKKVEVDEYGHD